MAKIILKMDYIWHYESPLGVITLASDGEALTGLWFDGQRHFGYSLHRETKEALAGMRAREEWTEVFGETVRWLDIFFSGRDPGFRPKLNLRVTPFQKRVCEAMLEIPFGETMTYGQMAAVMHSSARAVGTAVGRNPVSLIVPCHRVVGAGGRLTGYAGGLDRKARLLALERAAGRCIR